MDVMLQAVALKLKVKHRAAARLQAAALNETGEVVLGWQVGAAAYNAAT
jgi:hypothetical protein